MTSSFEPVITDETVAPEAKSRWGLVEAAAIVGLVMCVAGIALPWADFDFGSQGTFTGWNRRGFTTLGLAVLAFVVVVTTRSRWMSLVGAFAGGLAALLALDFWLGELNGLPKAYPGFELSLGPGLPLMLAGSSVLVAVAVFRFVESGRAGSSDE